MKNLIKKVIPNWLLDWNRNRVRNRNRIIVNSKYKNLSPKEVFSDIYNSNHWQSQESISGSGSETKQTETIIRGLEKLLKEKNIESVLDLPCGDFNWMQKVDLSNIDYTGADIVEDLIASNIMKYKDRENIKFKVLNLITDPLPKTDLIFVRDCLVHLSFEDINNAINNIKSSGSKYLLTTTFTDLQLNLDIVTGDWRPLNLQEKPFNFSKPLLVINENCTEGNGKSKDKSMALWEINKM